MRLSITYLRSLLPAAIPLFLSIPAKASPGRTVHIPAAAASAGDCPSPVLIDLRVILEGPYDTLTGLMRDPLRAAALLPSSEPYTARGYHHVAGGGGEAMAPGVAATTGATAIVDWVVVELRDASDPAKRLATRSALLCRNGTITDVDGVSPVAFCIPAGRYFVGVRHRNHLGILAARPVDLPMTGVLDLSDPATATWRAGSRKAMAGRMAMWSGDVNFDGTVKYTGTGNDRDVVLTTIGGTVPTATRTGFEAADVNMDGTVRYTGSGNDRDAILRTIGGTVPTAVRSGYLPTDTLKLRDRVHLVDQMPWMLDSAASDLSDHSRLVFTYTGPRPDVRTNDIVVGRIGEVYMRRVTGVVFPAGRMRVITQPAAFADVFQQGVLHTSMDLSDSSDVPAGAASRALSTSFDFLDGPGVSVRMEEVRVDIDHDLVIDSEFGFSGLKNAELSIRNASVHLRGKLVVEASASLAEHTIREPLYTLTYRGWAGYIPILVRTTISAVGTLRIDLAQAISGSIDIDLGCTADLGAQYYEGQWHDISAVRFPGPGLEVSFHSVSAEAAIVGSIALEATTTVNGLPGPYLSAAVVSTLHAACNPLLDRDHGTDLSLVIKTGIRARFLDLAQVDLNYSHPFPLATYTSPDSMALVSGNGQMGRPGQLLPQPVRVHVLDKYSRVFSPAVHPGAAGYRVYFDLVSGGGSIPAPVVTADVNGYAETPWTLGGLGMQEQVMHAYVLEADGDTVKGGPLVIQAYFDPVCPATVTDIDGNVYGVVAIGGQCWMTENLRTSRYRNGVPIPLVTDGPQWGALTTGARCDYANSGAISDVYGKLYNWYAAVDGNGVCPLGWHVPSDAEWMQLETRLGLPANELYIPPGSVTRGLSTNVGGKLKSTGLWNPPNLDATNESGFSGLPGGLRGQNDGPFLSLGNSGYWWSTTIYGANPVYGLNRGLYNSRGSIDRHSFGRAFGLCIRCLRN